jgi:uncharacterized protein YuzB (UPF0349 family)
MTFKKQLQAKIAKRSSVEYAALTFCFFCVKAKEKDSLKIEFKSDRKPRLQRSSVEYAALTFCFFCIKAKEKAFVLRTQNFI